MSSVMVFALRRNTLIKGLSAPDRRLQGPTQSLLVHQRTALDLLVLSALRLQVLDPCVAACRPRQRPTTSPQVLTMLLRHSLPPSPCRRRHLLRRTISCHPSLTVSPIPTTVPRQAACLHLHHRHPPDWVAHQVRVQLKGLLLSGALPAHHLRFDQSLKTARPHHATDIKGHTSITLTPLPAAALQVALPRQHLRWWLQKLRLGTGMTVLLPSHPSDTASGKRMTTPAPSLLRTRRSAKSLRSHTAVVRLPHIRCRRPRLRVTAHMVLQMHAASMTATTRLKPLTIRLPYHPTLRRHPLPACRKPQSKRDLSSTSRQRATWMLMRTTMMKEKTRRHPRQRPSAAAHAPPLPPTAHLTHPHQSSRSLRKTISIGRRMSPRGSTNSWAPLCKACTYHQKRRTAPRYFQQLSFLFSVSLYPR
jgi:hypothetical protein